MGNANSQSVTASNANSGQNNQTTSHLAKSFPHFIIDRTFPPGSGRIFRSYRIRCPTISAASSSITSNSTAASTTVAGAGSSVLVCKTMILRHAESKSDEVYAELAQKAKELERLKDILQDLPNICSYQKWFISSNTTVDHRTNTISQPIFLFRQHLYSTLSDRLTMRPFLTNIEKTWIAYQILRALSSLHERNIFHGNLTAENVCITSWGWVCIVDIGGNAGMKPVKMKDYDLSDFIYYYKKGEGGSQADGRNIPNSGGEGKKQAGCYLAPERFYKRGEEEKHGNNRNGFTSQIDVFAAGCIIIEMYLNGEKALDLGDLMEYRAKKTIVPSLKQKLNKIESSNIRAACKHMLSLDPSARLSAKEYLDKLSSGTKHVIPPCFEQFLWPFMRQFQHNPSDYHCWTHDAKVVLLAAEYGKGSLRCLMGKEDTVGEKYFRDVIGPTTFEQNETSDQPTIEPKEAQNTKQHKFLTDKILAETEALLTALESRTSALFPPTTSGDDNPSPPSSSYHPISPNNSLNEISSSPQSIILILQFLLSSIRHVHRPTSKLLSLQLLLYFNNHINDETRLQRIIPTTISLLDDTQAIIRARSLRVLTAVLECIESFPPSDAQLVPQYVMKRIQHLANAKEDEVVRVAFAECIGRLAVTSKRFLDISHVMRMQDSLDGGGSATSVKDMSNKNSFTSKSSDHKRNSSIPEFPDDVAQLLGAATPKLQNTENISKVKRANSNSEKMTEKISSIDANIITNSTLIPNTYDEEFQELQDVFTSFITQLTMSSSSHVKKALLLSSLSQLASFYGEEGTTTRLLPTILTFWNDLDNWEVRGALCQSLPSICHIIGRVGTEEFVLPCIEVACFDEEEGVVGWALWCLATLVEEKLIRGRAFLLGDMESNDGSIGVLEKYASLLIHPSGFIRNGALSLFCSSARAIGFPDDEVFILPILRPFLKYEPTREQLQDKNELVHCIILPVSRKSLIKFTEKIGKERNNAETNRENVGSRAGITDVFHSINIDESNASSISKQCESDLALGTRDIVSSNQSKHESSTDNTVGIPEDEEFRLQKMMNYLEMGEKRSKSMKYSSNRGDNKEKAPQPENNILLSDAYSFAVPNQKFIELVSRTLPDWYENFRSTAREDQNLASEFSPLTSTKSYAEVYGLSVTLPSNPTQPIRKWKNDYNLDESSISGRDEKPLSGQEICSILSGYESKKFDASIKGELGATVTLNPSSHEASILGFKMKSLGLPSLPPELGVLRDTDGRAFSWHGPVSAKNETNAEAILRSEWKPKVDSLVVSSTESMEHTAAVSRLAVSQDQSFFVSASHDGTCRVWELRQMEDAVDLQSSITYSGHCTPNEPKCRVNDVCAIENSHSVASASSSGSVHIWRVDISSSKNASVLSGMESQPTQSDTKPMLSSKFYETSRVSGSALVRNIDPGEGEILTVSHFNTSSASVVSFASQLGIHSWDLRCSAEPFSIPMRPELGYLTSMAIGNDRNWMVVGTNRGYLALWDIRFRSMVKLWQHSSAAPVARLATCFTTLPQDKGGNSQDRPFIFMGCGLNEAAIFDVSTGDCRQCFRSLDPSLCYIDQTSLPRACVTMPSLNEIPLPSHSKSRIWPTGNSFPTSIHNHRPPPEPSVQSIMGRIGKRGQSYIITGGSDRCIRYWDFMSVSRCYTVSGLNYGQPKPSFESIDVGSSGQLFLCRQAPTPTYTEIESAKLPKHSHRGLSRPDNGHQDAVLDLKNIDFPVKGLLSCSRDGVVKMWR